ncbi:phage head-tail connector protein [Eubacterium aggregans]|uniref:phage head-tail connector protein n=1 Tax=Eubacterium aggregans TaxID=81409 RepID=UPI003F2BF527
MALLERLKLRLPKDETALQDDELLEYITTATDRVNLRLGTTALPQLMESIVVDVAAKLLRRRYYEGIRGEGVDSLSTSFVENVLSEYEAEFTRYLSGRAKVVRFL